MIFFCAALTAAVFLSIIGLIINDVVQGVRDERQFNRENAAWEARHRVRDVTRVRD